MHKIRTCQSVGRIEDRPPKKSCYSKRLASWFKSLIPTDPGLNRGNYRYYYYNYTVKWFLDELRCQDSCCTEEGGRVPGTKALNPTPPVPSRGHAVAASYKDWFSRNWNTWAWYGYNIKHSVCTLPYKVSFADQAGKRPIIHGYGISPCLSNLQ